MIPLRVELAASHKWVAWLGIVFFGYCTLGSLRDGYAYWFLFLFFVGLSIFLLLTRGTIEMNDEWIRHITPLGHWQMQWDEVEKIEMEYEGGDTVLHGKGKRLALPGINQLSGESKEKMVELFNRQIKERGIVKRRTKRAGFQMSKNTKIKR